MAGTLLCGILSDYLNGRKFVTCLIFISICIPSIIFFPKIGISIYAGENTEGIGFSICNFFSNFSNFFDIFSSNSIFSVFRYLNILDMFTGDLGSMRLCLFFLGMGINGPKTLMGMYISLYIHVFICINENIYHVDT
jgi:sugar phosphate permease